MDIKLYDKSMLSRWKAYFDNTHWVRSSDTAQMDGVESRMEKDSRVRPEEHSSYPMFTLQRVGVPVIQRDNNISAVNRGLRKPEEEHLLTFSKFLLRYQLDIYSLNKENFDELLVETQENLIRYPYLDVITEDRWFGNQTFTLDLEDIQDLSDVESFREKSPVYRAAVVYTMEALIARRFQQLRVEEFIIRVERKDEGGKNHVIVDS